MTDNLIDKVHEAIRDVEGGLDKAEARAAIIAVAEWLGQSEDRECNPIACLRAELERVRKAAEG